MMLVSGKAQDIVYSNKLVAKALFDVTCLCDNSRIMAISAPLDLE